MMIGSRLPRAEVIAERRSLTKETLDLMARFINKDRNDPALCRIARRITQGARGPEDEAERIHRWVRTWIKYKPDPPGAELVQDAEAVLQNRIGDCDDMATLAGALLRCLGHQIEPLAVWWKVPKRERFTHAVVKDHTAGRIVDPVSPDFNQWPPRGREVFAMMGP